jgi:hypothetical protein
LELLHFTATWASAIRDPHKSEVRRAGQVLGGTVREVDVDEEPELTHTDGVLNVPAVAVSGLPSSRIVGAAPSDLLIEQLRSHVE